ncbi:hypothetical protein VAR608DRAFT_0322 [Variovorax sp. HW608]|uniref:hypothetical protein n=1 Tax=Variovorax sp. HW608 TaxID=1034889 RepID=UPI0008200BB9|nr:hypothetical protein [Variovorax sp. HW608]SCK09227.1 hypothetical protein VAR608DRAFT_0322 [Variovorax sp. HW608]
MIWRRLPKGIGVAAKDGGNGALGASRLIFESMLDKREIQRRVTAQTAAALVEARIDSRARRLNTLN